MSGNALSVSVGGGIIIFKKILIIISVLVFIFCCSVPASALHTLTGVNYSTLLGFRQDGCPTIQINYSDPWSFYSDSSGNDGVYDVNCIFFILPAFYYNSGGGRVYTCQSQVGNNTMYPADFDTVSMFNSNEITSDYYTGTSLDSMFTYLTFGFQDSNVNVRYIEFYICYGYYNHGGTDQFVIDDQSVGITTQSTLNLPYYYDYTSGFFLNPMGYKVANRCYINLGESFKIAHNISDIDVTGGVTTDVGGDECGCSNCCQCDCGYYTEQLQENLMEYFETNMVTQDMFETYMEENVLNVINNNSVNNDYTIINSMVSDTSFSADIESFVGNQDDLFSDLNSYGSQLDSFESQLTISPEVSQAAGILSGAFGSLPPSIIGALVFVLVMLVVVKILGR